MKDKHLNEIDNDKSDFFDDFHDPCPECETQLRAKELHEGGGVECPNPECDYWFCY